MQEETNQYKADQIELEKMKVKLQNEILLKQTAVNKLAEIMNRKDGVIPGKTKTKATSAADLRKKEKESRRLQQELTQEREKYNQLLLKFQDVQGQLTEENIVCILIINNIIDGSSNRYMNINLTIIFFLGKNKITNGS